MYESFFGFREKPFSLLPDPSFIYLSAKHQEALTLLEYGLMNQAGFIVLTGEIGVGKTTLMRELLGHLERDLTVGLISNTHTSSVGLLGWICAAFDIPTHSSNDLELHRALTDFLVDQYAQGKRTLLIIDEAQNLGPGHLEELRLLSNINSEKDLLLQLMLLGQPQLRDLLARPEHEQFVQRIAAAYHLTRLDPTETPAYIQHRLSKAGAWYEAFTAGACEAVHYYSKGIPRVVNLICDTALVYAYGARSRFVTEAIVDEVAESQSGQLLLRLEDPKARPRTAAPISDHASAGDRAAGESASPQRQPEDPPAPSADAQPRDTATADARGAQRQAFRSGASGDDASARANAAPPVSRSDGVPRQRTPHGDVGPDRPARAVGIVEPARLQTRRETTPMRHAADDVPAAPASRGGQSRGAIPAGGLAGEAPLTREAVSDRPPGSSRAGRRASMVGLIAVGVLIAAMALLLWLGAAGSTHWLQSLIERAQSTLARDWIGGASPSEGKIAPATPGSRPPAGADGENAPPRIQDATNERRADEAGVAFADMDDAGRARSAQSAETVPSTSHGSAPDAGSPATLPDLEPGAGDAGNRGASGPWAESAPSAVTAADGQRTTDIGDVDLDNASSGPSADPTPLPESSAPEVEDTRGNGARSLDPAAASTPSARPPGEAMVPGLVSAPPASVTPPSKPSALPMDALEADLSALDISVERPGPGRVIAGLGDHVGFSGGSVVLDTGAQAFLQQLAAALAPYQPLRLRVVGHTDLSGGAATNQRLSERRAEAVAAFLSDTGLSPGRISFEGRGESEPKVALEQEWALGPSVNRRIEIELGPVDRPATERGDPRALGGSE